MNVLIDEAKRESLADFRAFASTALAPFAGEWDRRQEFPREAVDRMADAGYLGFTIATDFGGHGGDSTTFGLLNEAIGGACSSARCLLTVHSMVAHAIQRWGGDRLRNKYLPSMARGRQLGAFCLTEPSAGSDTGAIATTAEVVSEGIRLRGTKTWITFGEIADVFLVFAKVAEKPVAVLVERGTPGLRATPIRDVLGVRASMLAEITLDGCVAPAENVIGGRGLGLSCVAATALELGRFSVAWGCIGLAQACLDASARYALERHASGRPIAEHQLVRRMISNMVVDVAAARLLCLHAGRVTDDANGSALYESFAAKYLAATTAMRVANDAVEIHGGAGCSSVHQVERFFRDAKVMELIEGTNEIQQDTIARFCFQQYKVGR